MTIKFGCHTSTWVLDYDKEVDCIDHIIDVVSDAGFQGVDVQVALLGKYDNDPEKLKAKLDSKGIELAALTVPFTWPSDTETEEERKRADHYIEYVKHFPGAKLNIPVRNGPNRDNLLQRQKEIMKCVNAVAKRAYENGVVSMFHPASPATSYFRIASDYEVMFESLDTHYIGYTPDAGHITKGGMNAVDVVREHLPIIKHVHIKDCNNDLTFAKMGQGDIDFPAMVKSLVDYGYDGWIMVEEETAEAATDPDRVIHDVYQYVAKNLKPIVE
ncbi:sugar phosphate isomerase/epimerase (plasmid) [Alicyclobacillus fastidiosus]|uniref:Sugar phosphate isomerase/epimerase n=1 Tax=Alicyclobacillus fastidiosus TaxID=392011 RepID=A0ABY6ZS42_9BACL|nr:sugar phosphate isomerase/epimerase [Alicyclobacillus fastidiosus]WAH44780.1 sugar phosphate isomerase/epimerase [Alicyclobacillus fastidiosus]GMA65734.1 inosose dehydratase [Alicyclobacillus fastidiosus]GMA65907.1 inosose dehydratase [Alicyclobacillus fastidiosus]